MTLELIAPAKLNLTLEILGKREDGYHDVMSLMQTIDLGTPVSTASVTLRLVTVSEPGTGRSARDFTAISEVSLLGTPAG